MSDKYKKLVLKEEIVQGLMKVGMDVGDNVMVHCSLGAFGYICGGAQTVIEALIQVVGEEGTILMPTQSWKNLDPSTGVHWDVEEKEWQLIRDHWPAYNKNLTPTNTMGAVAEMFRQWPGVLRSDHPARSIAAWGKNAQYFTENHDLSNIFGVDSPVDRLYTLKGKVLLFGVGYDKNTSLHLADAVANYPSKHMVTESSAMMVEGLRAWVDYETLFVDGEDFILIGKAFEEKFENNEAVLSKTMLNNGMITFMDQKCLVDFAVDWIEKYRK